MKVIVLGAGLVGGPMAVDLSQDARFEVTAVDLDPVALEKLRTASTGIRLLERDLSNPDEVTSLVSDFDLVLSAVPGFLGFETLAAVINAGKDVVDISFFPEDPFELDQQAQKNKLTAIVDCGLAPGMSNILVGHLKEQLDQIYSAIIYVGGLPERREWPYEYQAVFSPMDVIAEYTRPARFVECGQPVVRPALSDPELIDFPKIGTLEAFNTDGLRTLIHTIDAPNLKEKTLRYPGHMEKMAMLRETGFFSEREIEVGGVRIRPIDLTSKLLFPKWQMKAGDVDITVMRVIVEGEKTSAKKRYTYDLFDRFDSVSGVHSMARTTGYTATVTLRLLANNLYNQPGISPPEYLGRHDACFDYLIRGLKERGIVYQEAINDISDGADQ